MHQGNFRPQRLRLWEVASIKIKSNYVSLPSNDFVVNFLQFTEIIFVDHQTGARVYFKRQINSPITAAVNYGNAAAVGLWHGIGASNAYTYQLLICDHSFYSGFFISGYTSNCYKRCNSWCGDTASPYFRTASTSTHYRGVAFNTNGHSPNIPSSRLISVGLRWVQPIDVWSSLWWTVIL